MQTETLIETRTHPSALRTDNLQFSYQQQIMQFPDIELDAGQTCAVLGPSGCGKTTFLHLIAGLLTPQSGSVWVAGRNISALAQRDLDRRRGQDIGIVLQQLRLVKALSVMDNLLLATRLGGRGGPNNELPGRKPASATQQATSVDPAKHAEALLTQLDVQTMAHRRPAELSQGQAQRVAIARALMNQPALILADEPTSSLDDIQAEKVIHLLMQIASTHQAALLVVTHDARIRGHFDQEITLA